MTIADMVRRYRRGWTTRQLAVAAGLPSHTMVSHRLRAAGVTLRGRGGDNRPRPLQGRDREIARLRLDGLSVPRIADRFGLSKQRVWAVCRRELSR